MGHLCSYAETSVAVSSISLQALQRQKLFPGCHSRQRDVLQQTKRNKCEQE